MRLAYADPPYPGCAHLYRDHPDFAGEVDYPALVARLRAEFDGWVLHTNATPSSIRLLAPLVPEDARWMSWVKGFAAFKRNVSVAYAWEPVIVLHHAAARPDRRETRGALSLGLRDDGRAPGGRSRGPVPGHGRGLAGLGHVAGKVRPAVVIAPLLLHQSGLSFS